METELLSIFPQTQGDGVGRFPHNSKPLINSSAPYFSLGDFSELFFFDVQLSHQFHAAADPAFNNIISEYTGSRSTYVVCIFSFT